MIVKWTNLTSNESGYVRSVDYKRRYFINTYDITQAKNYKPGMAEKIIEKLIEYGEGDRNRFELIDPNK